MPLFNLLGKSKPLAFQGQTFDVSPLTFGDVADIERHFGFNLFDTEAEPVGPMAQTQAIYWAVFRKLDSRLTPEQRAAGEYILTPDEMANELPLAALLTAEGQGFVRQVMELSGVAGKEGETKNEAGAATD